MSPLLSICIPIYNRSKFLENMLEVFLKNKAYFVEKVQLYISDNCSEEDLQSVCTKFKNKGLNLQYHRNATNLGMDGNFENCFKNAIGKYVCLLGSDDIPCDDFFEKVLPILENQDCGVVHISPQLNDLSQKSYNNPDDFLIDLGVMITFISNNIVNAKYIQTINYSVYKGTLLTQVPLYLKAIISSKQNLLIDYDWIRKDYKRATTNGYNLFKVFVDNLLGIMYEPVKEKLIKPSTYDIVKKKIYKYFLMGWIYEILIKGENKRFESGSAFSILFKHYGLCPYAYYLWVTRPICKLLKLRD